MAHAPAGNSLEHDRVDPDVGLCRTVGRSLSCWLPLGPVPYFCFSARGETSKFPILPPLTKITKTTTTKLTVSLPQSMGKEKAEVSEICPKIMNFSHFSLYFSPEMHE